MLQGVVNISGIKYDVILKSNVDLIFVMIVPLTIWK